jgi:hypothetical protein
LAAAKIATKLFMAGCCVSESTHRFELIASLQRDGGFAGADINAN